MVYEIHCRFSVSVIEYYSARASDPSVRTGDKEMRDKGTLVQWTCEDGTVLHNADEVGAYVPPEAWERETLANVMEHMGQTCELLEVFEEDENKGMGPTYHVRFADGWETYAFNRDVWFD